jgi:hypothetical protein
MTQIAPALGVLAALIGIASTVPYVRDTFRRSTQPHRGTWLVWSVLQQTPVHGFDARAREE